MFLNHQTITKNKKYYCLRCTCGFSSQSILDEHMKYCSLISECKTIYPSKYKNYKDGKWTYSNEKEGFSRPANEIYFYNDLKKIAKQFKHPYILVGDFEAVMTKSDYSFNVTHEMISFGALSISEFTPLSPHIFTGSKSDIINSFHDFLMKKVAEYKSIQGKAMNPLTPQQEEEYNKSTTCHLCLGKLSVDKKVHDHDHFSGEYRGPAHTYCNTKIQEPKFIPFFFHNLRGYDSHFIIQILSEIKNLKINVIANSSEKYLSISTIIDGIQIRFLDSYQFMLASLESLAKNLGDNKPITKSILENKFPNFKNDIPLLFKKGVFPYSWFDSQNKLNNTELPPIEDFYDVLTESNIKAEEYERAESIWSNFHIQNIKEYLELYLLVDVLLLGDVIDSFRKISMRDYGLDPVYYYTSPNFAWDALLKHSKAKLDLITDPNIFLIEERKIRGGLSQCFTERIVKNDNDTKILYLDCNNLYGTAMSLMMPVGGHHFIDPNIVFENFTPKSDKHGYTFVVDLIYPNELHDKHILPMAPEVLEIQKEWLNTWQQESFKKYQKLCAHFFPRTNYVVDYEILKFYIKHGLKITKIHKIIEYDQDIWMKSYIDFNTEKRTRSKNDFEKDFYKLMNNSVFGKSMENVRDRDSITLTDQDHLPNHVRKSNYKLFNPINNNLILVKYYKSKVVLNKPIFVGAKILDISKLIMYQFMYDVLLPTFSDKLKLHYMDTDSFILSIKDDDYEKKMMSIIDSLDTSEYDSKFHDSPLYKSHPHPQRNKKVLGKFKSETNGFDIKGFVGLRSKMYAIDSEFKQINKCKGLTKKSVSKLTFDSYLNILKNKKDADSLKQIKIISKKHIIETEISAKKNLCIYDDKNFILEDRITMRPLGHYLNKPCSYN
jgi:hypothetical protein